MKKILISISGIVAVAALVVASTGALFSDTETSAANVFTAGSIDLKVDHLAQSYNGVDCKTCTVTLVSDTSNEVVATTGGSDPVVMPHAAVQVLNPNPGWTVTGDIPGATWIWATEPTLDADAIHTVDYTFRKTFNWMGPISGATLSLGVGSDNGFEVRLNGNVVGADPSEFNYHSPAHTYSSFGSFIVQGANVLEIKVTNLGREDYTGAINPGGLLYKLTIDGNCGGAYFQNHCSLFQEKDLTAADHFWNISDVKPGDYGTNLISLHVTSNDAYACFYDINKQNNENDLVSAETKAGDVTTGPTGNGELSKYLNVVVWPDADQDSVHQAGETPLFTGKLSDLMTQRLNVPTGSVNYLGLAWCFGAQSVDPTSGAISCDGSGNAYNDAQTDSFVADAVLYAVQQRNNSNFSCNDLTPN